MIKSMPVKYSTRRGVMSKLVETEGILLTFHSNSRPHTEIDLDRSS